VPYFFFSIWHLSGLILVFLLLFPLSRQDDVISIRGVENNFRHFLTSTLYIAEKPVYSLHHLYPREKISTLDTALKSLEPVERSPNCDQAAGWIRVGGKWDFFVQIFQRRNEAHLTSYSTVSGCSSLQGKATGKLTLTIRLYLVSSLRMSEALTLIPHIYSWCAANNFSFT